MHEHELSRADIDRLMAERLEELIDMYLSSLDGEHHIEYYATGRGFGKLVLLGDTSLAGFGWDFPGFLGWVKEYLGV